MPEKPVRIHLSDSEVLDLQGLLNDLNEEFGSKLFENEHTFVLEQYDNVAKYKNISIKQVEWLGKIWKKWYKEQQPLLATIWRRGAAK